MFNQYTLMSKKIFILFILICIICLTPQTIKANSPVTVFYPICWEPIKIDSVDKDYTRFHLGYWSSGGEEFRVSIKTGSGYAGWGSLRHDTTSEWKTIPGSVDDMVLTVYSEDANNLDVNSVSIQFISEYHEYNLELSTAEIDQCIIPWPSWNNNTQPDIVVPNEITSM